MHGRRELLRSPGTWRGRGHLGRYLGEIATDQHLILRAEWAFCPPPPPPRVSELSCVTDVLGRAGPWPRTCWGDGSRRAGSVKKRSSESSREGLLLTLFKRKLSRKFSKRKLRGRTQAASPPRPPTSAPAPVSARPEMCFGEVVVFRSLCVVSLPKQHLSADSDARLSPHVKWRGPGLCA